MDSRRGAAPRKLQLGDLAVAGESGGECQKTAELHWMEPVSNLCPFVSLILDGALNYEWYNLF